MNTAAKANTITYATIDRPLINGLINRHSTQPASLLKDLFRRARHTVIVMSCCLIDSRLLGVTAQRDRRYTRFNTNQNLGFL